MSKPKSESNSIEIPINWCRLWRRLCTLHSGIETHCAIFCSSLLHFNSIFLDLIGHFLSEFHSTHMVFFTLCLLCFVSKIRQTHKLITFYSFHWCVSFFWAFSSTFTRSWTHFIRKNIHSYVFVCWYYFLFAHCSCRFVFSLLFFGSVFTSAFGYFQPRSISLCLYFWMSFAFAFKKKVGHQFRLNSATAATAPSTCK